MDIAVPKLPAVLRVRKMGFGAEQSIARWSRAKQSIAKWSIARWALEQSILQEILQVDIVMPKLPAVLKVMDPGCSS